MYKMALVTTLVLAVAAGGCKKKPPAPMPEAPEAATPAADEQVPAAVVQELKRNFERVSFDFDSTSLGEASKQALTRNAEIMQRHPRVTVEVQGHADERGTTDYNIALGQKRAQAVRAHLMRMGVAGARIEVVSYGEERPAVSGQGEPAWSQNRRAEFRVLMRDPNVVGTTEE